MNKLFSVSSTVLFSLVYASNTQNTNMRTSIHQFEMKDIRSEVIPLSKDKVVLIINVASKCGLTPQYADLEFVYEAYKDCGFVILGFPANNFMGQEPGTNEEIAQFCSANYGVTFPMFSKISVKGKEIHPLYDFLTDKEKKGLRREK